MAETRQLALASQLYHLRSIAATGTFHVGSGATETPDVNACRVIDSPLCDAVTALERVSEDEELVQGNVSFISAEDSLESQQSRSAGVEGPGSYDTTDRSAEIIRSLLTNELASKSEAPVESSSLT
jgi:hypothetical protein